MRSGEKAAAQLHTIGWLHAVLGRHGIDYWLFGGWAVDFHVGRVTRAHEDVDVAVWQSDMPRLEALLVASGWTHAPEPDQDGYTAYRRGDVHVELAFLERDEAGTVYTPRAQGRGEWPQASFGDVVTQVEGVRARVVGLASLIEDKSGVRDDANATAKDRADVAVLRRLGAGESVGG